MTDKPNKNGRMIAFLFDAAKIPAAFYGAVVFEYFVKGREVCEHSEKTVFSVGDILDDCVYDDLQPFLIRDDLCTVKRITDIQHGDIFVFLVEDIGMQTARRIDARLGADFAAYLGMTSVDMKSSDPRKQFWKLLVRRFSIEGNILTVFGCREDGFGYQSVAEEQGFHIFFDGFLDDNDSFDKTDLMPVTRRSSVITSTRQLSVLDGQPDADRGLLEMNFSLVRELDLAGVQIWKSIEDINRATITR